MSSETDDETELRPRYEGVYRTRGRPDRALVSSFKNNPETASRSSLERNAVRLIAGFAIAFQERALEGERNATARKPLQ